MTEQKFKCVIVEDEDHNMFLIKDYISKIDSLDLIGTFISPVDLLNSEQLSEVQIIYLDIQMPDMTGIEFLKAIPVNAEVIFTTAYSEYAIEGYQLNVTDYLLKPVELPRFIQATKKAVNNIKLKTQQQGSETDEYIMLKVDKRLVKVFVNDIVYIKSDWDYVHVYLKDEKYMVLNTMKNMEDSLSKYQFIRIHKSYLINLHHFEFLEGNEIQIQGTKLPVSRNYKKGLLDLL